MKIEETISGGFNEINIIESCEFELFYTFSDILKETLSISYTKKVDDFDTLYWVFQYDYVPMILHYSTFLGIIIYPENARHSSDDDDKALHKIFNILDKKGIPDIISKLIIKK